MPPTLLSLCRLLRGRPQGVSKEEACRRLEAPPAWVDRALEELVRAGLVEERGGLLVPCPKFVAFADKMTWLYYRLNEVTAAKDLVSMILPRRKR